MRRQTAVANSDDVQPVIPPHWIRRHRRTALVAVLAVAVGFVAGITVGEHHIEYGPLFRDGIYWVGRGMSAGTYSTPGPDRNGMCSWERLRDTSGDSSAIIAIATLSGPQTVTVAPTDAAVEFSGGCTWTRSL